MWTAGGAKVNQAGRGWSHVCVDTCEILCGVWGWDPNRTECRRDANNEGVGGWGLGKRGQEGNDEDGEKVKKWEKQG